MEKLSNRDSACLSPEFFGPSIGNTVLSNNPSIQLLQRWQSLSARIASQNFNRLAVVALNRKLDEVEDILSAVSAGPSNHQGTLPPEHHVHNFASLDTEELPSFPNTSEDVTQPEDVLGGSIRSSALLERVGRTMDQLRQRQRDFKVCV